MKAQKQVLPLVLASSYCLKLSASLLHQHETGPRLDTWCVALTTTVQEARGEPQYTQGQKRKSGITGTETKQGRIDTWNGQEATMLRAEAWYPLGLEPQLSPSQLCHPGQLSRAQHSGL